MTNTLPPPTSRRWPVWWPWALLLVLALPALWHDLVFPSEIDGEFPDVIRPTFSAHPPPAYRLAEPGDTIDRVSIYVSSIAVVLATLGLALDRANARIRLAALIVALTALWFASTPGPTFDGWHGLGFQAIADPTAPVALRWTLGAVAFAIGTLLAACFGIQRERWTALMRLAIQNRVAGLLCVAGLMTIGRIVSFPDVEPLGYWPRWLFVWALVAYSAVLIRLLPRIELGRPAILAMTLGGISLWYSLVAGAVWLTWYHRPLERLRTVVAGKIYMSAMPTAKGLALAQERHHFKTIINLFPEDTAYQSPRYPEEVRFAREHGLNYVLSPSEVSASNEFLDKTLALAQDSNAWPILVHCHACMDRTPAWVGIYRFVVEGQPLADVMRFIEGHRGYRPKASVTLLYNRVLPRLAPEQAKSDPTARELEANAAGTDDPYYKELSNELEDLDDGANPARRVVSKGRRPSLTPPR